MMSLYGAVSKATDIWQREAGESLLEIARRMAPSSSETRRDGHAKFNETLYPKVYGAGTDRYMEIHSSSTRPMAIFVREGTIGHEIGGQGQLLFNPDTQFAARGPVFHPGTRPNDWGQRALDAVQGELMDSLATVVISYLQEALHA